MRPIFYSLSRPSWQSMNPVRAHIRTFLTLGNLQDKSMSYKERRLLGYSQQQMFNIAADVGKYREFVPWCNESVIVRKTASGAVIVRLGVGFPPLSESYTSTVTLQSPAHVKSVAHSSHMFEYLINQWNFWPGLVANENTCMVEFSVDFEFKSALYAKVAGLFFDQVVAMMVSAFITRAQTLHGPASIPPQKPDILVYKKC
ncbi:Coenzyme Q-binding protein COQ10 B, mitochondrial [Clonorchis sinensis]|uniref:Coenzyme Q-binding protein COQ10 B, mitochondrial n=1 Tax=Clonorchis sinensis TaxID=79923 RepID=A0A8T1MXN8_CLOSI|nr:Coenzyme Q-binding protein COQ10 B, mitochondrial [Clonorchis sinensis]